MWEVYSGGGGRLGTSSVPTMVLGTGDPQMREHSPSCPPPAKCFPCVEQFSAMTLDLSFHSSSGMYFSTHIVLFQNVPEAPWAKDSIVQQTFIVHHWALHAAAGAGDTKRDKMKCLPLGSSKLGTTSDNSAVSIGMQVATQPQRESRYKLPNLIPFNDDDDKLCCAKPSMFTISFHSLSKPMKY